MTHLTLEEKAWIRVIAGVLESSETIEENNARLAAMRSSDVTQETED